MKKVLALVLALIMVLAMGVTSFAASITLVDLGEAEDTELPFYDFDIDWDIANENLIAIPYNIGDAGTLIDGSLTAEALGFNATDNTLSSVKVESEKGIVDVSVYKLNDYVKSFEYEDVTVGAALTKEVVGINTKTTWPFDDFDLEDLVPTSLSEDDPQVTYFAEEGFTWNDAHDDADLDLYFVYFDIPTYSGAKVSTDNYFTMKFRENTTGADYVEESEKVWICVYPYAVYEGDVETYADEDEAMELEEGYPLIGETQADMMDFFENVDAYEDVDLLNNVMLVTAANIFEDYGDELDETPYVVTKDAWAEIVGSTLIVGADDDLEVEIGKIVKGQSGISFAFGTDVGDDIQDINEDAELAALIFFDTANVLDSDFTVKYTFEIEDVAATGDYYLYELIGDELTLNQKVAVGKGDDEVDVAIERKAGDTLGQYYLSDVELATEAAEAGTTEENPNTGASEVAGVAVALAVISLVSAAAVSLKK